jgi:uncharacterized protein (TIRG00374 family)
LTLIGLAAFLAYIFIFKVDIQEMMAKIQQIDLGPYILATAASLLDTVFFTSAWHSLLKFLKVRILWFKSFIFVWIGIFVDDIIPAESVSGDLAKIYLVDREQEGTVGAATASMVAQRLIGMVINVATLLVGAALLLIENLLSGMILNLILFLVAMTFLFLALILLLCFKQGWTFRIVDGVTWFADRITRGRWKLSKLREELIEDTKAFHRAIKDYAHAPKTIFIAASFSAISWLLALTVFYLIFLSIPNAHISWSAILVISAIFVAVKSIPIGVPFEVGLPEITLSTLLFFFTGNMETSVLATILLRLPTFWLKFVIGLVAQQWLGIKNIMASTEDGTDLAKA